MCTLFFTFCSGRNERLKSRPWLVVWQVIALAHPLAFCHKDPLKLSQFSLNDFCIWPSPALNWGMFANLSSQYWIFCQISPNLFLHLHKAQIITHTIARCKIQLLFPDSPSSIPLLYPQSWSRWGSLLPLHWLMLHFHWGFSATWGFQMLEWHKCFIK